MVVLLVNKHEVPQRSPFQYRKDDEVPSSVPSSGDCDAHLYMSNRSMSTCQGPRPEPRPLIIFTKLFSHRTLLSILLFMFYEAGCKIYFKKWLEKK